MEVLSALLCDSAADYGGKLSVLGAFDSIFARQFPAVHPHCSVAIRLLFRSGEEGHYRVDLCLIDPDGKPVLPTQHQPHFEFTLAPIPEEVFFLSRNLVINLQGLPLPKPALYSFDLAVNDQLVARIPLQVVQRD